MPLARSGPEKLASRTISRRNFLKASSFVVLAPSIVEAITLDGSASRPAVPRRRLRDLGIIIGELAPGSWNAITDVPGVRVGHCTRVEGAGETAVRTGITAVFPNADVLRDRVAAAHFIMNGNGEMTGTGAIDFAGLLESPIFLTDTSNLGRVMNGAISWHLKTYAEIGDSMPMPVPVVGETFGAFLHDGAGRHLHDEEVFAAIAAAATGPVAEGAVGGGTGMVCYEFKGGIGTSSRVLPANHGGYKIGVLVQANHGSREDLTIKGVPVGREITELMPVTPRKEKSILLIGATDAPMLPSQLQRLCRRMAVGLARTGSRFSHGSGDLLLFFSTGLHLQRDATEARFEIFNDEWLNIAYQGAIEASEEAILNALCMAETVTGVNGNTAFALPIERVLSIMRRHGN